MSALNAEGPHVAVVDYVPASYMTQIRGDRTYSNSDFLPDPLMELKWKSSHAVLASPAIFHKLSSRSPHISRFTILLSKLISIMCLYHPQVIWWHFQKRQEVLTLSGMESYSLLEPHRQQVTLYTRVLEGLGVTVHRVAVIIVMRHL